ncbi:FxsA family protein [Aliiglaciecola sp. CAU 1673]|uniref:FxsA family protein n=1 Tax=Aliiglaciecola sp. CAU 1673 TaxID=3032595 RepID=UPI0023DA63DF|nr:FxsA family protein [Aliiglaciecola sp. CAU 1673]MDF2177889.1 FxsA family protein [Aliiglaciecola sp. CAU 1673]
MGKILFLLFVLIPIAEIALLLEVGERIGGWETIGLILLTAFIGAALVRHQGMSTLFEARRRMDMGEVPGQQMAEGMLLLIAGVLLVTPGFVTDAFGFLLVLPVTRPLLARALLSKMQLQVVQSASVRYGEHVYQSRAGDSHRTFEGQFEVKNGRDDKDDEPPSQLPPR